MTDSLFFPSEKVNWTAILALDTRTAIGRVFHALIAARGGWVPGESLEAAGGGWDFRTRAARLRGKGVPVYSQESKAGKACHEYRIPVHFIDEYQQRKRQVA